MKPKQSYQCPLADVTHYIWHGSEETTLTFWISGKRECNQRFQIPRVLYEWIYQKAQRIATLRKTNAREQKPNKCKRRNNSSKKPSYKFSSDSSCLNPMWTVPNQNICFFNTETTLSFSDQSIQEILQTQSNNDRLDKADIHGTEDLKTEKVPLTIKEMQSKVHLLEVFVQPSISMVNGKYNYKK